MNCKRRFLVRHFSICILAMLLTACSGTHDKYSKPISPELRPSKEFSSPLPSAALPWEIWPLRRSLDGEPLNSRSALFGDELLKAGKRQNALSEYQRALSEKLSLAEREAVILRTASCQLALGDPVKALAGMSQHFKSRGKTENEVHPLFSLVFGYAYGNRGDTSQSLAWFSRAHRSGLIEAEQGVRLLLQSLPDETLLGMSKVWATDSGIGPLIGQERRRRARGGAVVAVTGKQPFWNPAGSAVPVQAEIQPLGATVERQVGVLLPLSGQFAALGQAAKNGIELAFEAQRERAQAAGENNPFSLVVKDYAGDALQSAAAAHELFAVEQADVVLGPLLTDSAIQVAEIARQTHKTILTFSKNDNFPLGNGVYRLGPTIQSQTESLLNSCQQSYGFTRFALVFPDDVTGQDFAHYFREALRIRGLEPVLERSYPKDQFNYFIQIASELDSLDVQAVFFPDSLRAASRFFSTLSPQVLQRVRPLGTASWDNSLELQQSRTALDRAVFVSPFFIASSRPELQRFVASYQNKYGRLPDFRAAQGFDAADLLFQALYAARREALPVNEILDRSLPYDGLTGRLQVSASGEVFRQFTVVTMQQGQLLEVSAAAARGETVSATEPLSNRY